jgi:hypothetical protein
MTYTGKDILALGIQPGPHIRDMLARANATGICTYDALSDLLPPPTISLQPAMGFSVNIHAETDDERANLNAVLETMRELTKTPVVEAAAVMPDACPAGPVGTIPVGGVVASKHVHPGMHSADVCCSVMVSTYDGIGPDELMERIAANTHFGPGGRPEHKMRDGLRRLVLENPFTEAHEGIADWHMGTQGDGNHFSFIGTLKSTGQTTLVTHHGSRGFGARVYKHGMKVAEKYRQKLSPDTLKQNAWIPNDTQDFADYMAALDIVARWTQDNHAVIHEAAGAQPHCLMWTKHNFVFERDGLLYHAKGSTPAWGEREAIPLNMAEPVLIVEGCDNPNALGFCPHGAGRNYSRSEHKRRGGADIESETVGLDVRFWCGKPDESELPSAYKNAASVRRDIEAYGLAKVVDEVLPYGAIMAGEWR